jgi:copper chaperone
MKKTFKTNNISCSSCAKLIKGSLEDDFGVIDINLDVTPKEVTVDIQNSEQELLFKEKIAELGFEVIED